jgi:ketosteroid isomerase-like protein
VASEDPVADYYTALDTHDYDALRDCLAPDFVQQRPDRRFDSREAFVRFMRDERPDADTTHRVHACYVPRDSAETEAGRTETGAEQSADTETTEVVARGDLLSAEGDPLVRFVDRFRITEETITELETFTR